MSKSAESPNGLINLLDDPKATAKKIKSAVTDAETVVRFDREAKPGVSNLLTIISTITGEDMDSLVASYEGKMYGHLKADVAQVVVDAVAPIKARTEELLTDPSELDRLLARGAAKAREIASRTLADVYERVGFLPALAPAAAAVG
jgi:tryptophanyl-tRNA synthetase